MNIQTMTQPAAMPPMAARPRVEQIDSPPTGTDTERYARCVQVSKRVRWDIDRDVIRGREFDFTQKFLPDGLTLIERYPFLSERQKTFMCRGARTRTCSVSSSATSARRFSRSAAITGSATRWRSRPLYAS